MLEKACSRSASVTSSTWSKRAIAVRTCAASVSGSLRLSGNAKTLSGRRFLSRVSSSPCCSCGLQVVVAIRPRYPRRARSCGFRAGRKTAGDGEDGAEHREEHGPEDQRTDQAVVHVRAHRGHAARRQPVDLRLLLADGGEED